jgi:tetratricopeptide (TPR) repeat protein
LTLKAARALKEMKQFEEALHELEKVLVVQPASLPFLKEKAFILNRMKAFDRALEVFERIKEISPEDSFVRKEILRLRSRKRPETQVLKELKTIIAMDSKKDDAQMHGLLAQKLKGAGLFQEAAAEYRRASALDPNNLYFMKQHGFCLYREARYDEAIHCLEEAFHKDPSDAVVRKTLEKIYEVQGNMARYLTLLEEIYQQHPDRRPLLGTIRRIRKKLALDSPQED